MARRQIVVKAKHTTSLKYRLNNRAWTVLKAKHRSYCAAKHLPCARCGNPIDYSLPYKDDKGRVNVWAYETGHKQPRSVRPDLMYVWSNLQAEHVTCNRGAQDKATVPQQEWVRPAW